MGERRGHRVSGIVRADDVRQFQHQLGHALNLLLFGLSVSGHRLLDLHGGVFIQRLRIPGAAGDRNTPGRAHGKGGGHILGKEQLLKHDGIRAVEFNQGFNALINLLKAYGQRVFRQGLDDA